MEIENLTAVLKGEIITANFNSGTCKVKVQIPVDKLPDFELHDLNDVVKMYLEGELV